METTIFNKGSTIFRKTLTDMKIIDKKNHLVNLINQFDSNKNIFQNIATESTDYIFYLNLPLKIQNKRFNIILPYVNLNGKLVLDVETFFTANGFNNVDCTSKKGEERI
jgi:hypothetical protein